MPTPLSLSTELKAVNVILAGTGELPVDSLEEAQSSNAGAALAALQESSLSLQVHGWYWNKEDSYPLVADTDGFINLPENTLKVNEAYWDGGTKDLVQRGQRLYNRTDHTYAFVAGTTVKVDLVVWLTWDELPEDAKQAIFYLAQRRFQMRELTSRALDAAITEDVDAALAMLQRAEDERGPANIFTDSPQGLARTLRGARRLG